MIIRRVRLACGDVKNTFSFYSDVLQFPGKINEDDSISFSIGHSMLDFYYDADYENAYYHFAFAIPHNLFEESLNWIKQRTNILPFDDEGEVANFTNWNARSFYFHDNRNNILEFISHFDLPPSTSKLYDASEVKGVCEVGIAVDDVQATCRLFSDTYKVPFYHKGPSTPSFAVMGTDEGLLIVSQTGRGWLPTQVPCLPFPLKVEGQNGDELFTIEY